MFAGKMFELHLVAGAGAPRRLAPIGVAPLLIGRSATNDVVLDDERISSRHVRVWADGDRLRVRDLGSRNGTRVNGTAVVDDAAIGPGDEIELGESLVLRVVPAERPIAAELPVDPAEAWAAAVRLVPALLAAGRRSAALQLLVDEVRRLTDAPTVIAVVWSGAGADRVVSGSAHRGDVTRLFSIRDDAVSGWLVDRVLDRGETVWSDDASTDARLRDRPSVVALALHSVGCVPLGPSAVLYLADPGSAGRFPPGIRLQVEALCAVARPFVAGAGPVGPAPEPLPGMVGGSPAMGEVFDNVRAFAPMPWPVLILGETGTGKERVAHAIHALSGRSGPFVAVNCGALSDEVDAFDRAAGGTLFLDEVGELSIAVQTRLLRVLQEVPLRARVIAATHRTLDDPATRAPVRDDLYHRLAACGPPARPAAARAPARSADPAVDRRDPAPPGPPVAGERPRGRERAPDRGRAVPGPGRRGAAARAPRRRAGRPRGGGRRSPHRDPRVPGPPGAGDARRVRRQPGGGRAPARGVPPVPVPGVRPGRGPRRMTAYRVVRRIGEGGVGQVYEAVRESGIGAGRRVAIKVLHGAGPGADPDTSTLERFRDEARILSMVRDRAVVWADVPVRLEDGWAVVMDLAPGVDVARLLAVAGPCPPAAAIELVGEVARALHNLWHHEGPDGPLRVLHRDLKPSNLQISRSGEVRILDFGNARAEFADREARTTRHIGGTPGYIAPERLAGQDGPEGDVYSLGVVLTELCTGTGAVHRHTPRTVPVRTEASTAETPIPAGSATVPDAIAALAAAMTLRSPEARPTAHQVARQCRDLSRGLAGESLADWAERAVPAATRVLPDDARIGTRLVVAR
ncbi:MAG: sigma 54-interacting transcriptional regulator [Myxococcota bacterium]